MLARCPHCQTIFRIAVTELRAARGLVRCGVCLSLFNAVDALCEDRAAAGPSVPYTGPRAPAGVAVPAREAWTDEGGAGGASPAGSADGLGLALGPLEAAPGAEHLEGLARAMWRGGAVALLILLVAQVSWFQGQHVLTRFPALRPPAQWACAWLGCKLPVVRDPQQVRLISRDVRAHPRYREALLINAVFVNTAGFRQSFPVLELGVYDSAGALLAARRFQPGEYLGGDIEAGRGMEPGLPVHVVLELLATELKPEGFELSFL